MAGYKKLIKSFASHTRVGLNPALNQTLGARNRRNAVNLTKLWRLYSWALLMLFFSTSYATAAQPSNGALSLGGNKTEVWGGYKIRHSLFPSEEWEFFVIVVPASVRQGTLIKMAKDFYAKYPNTRVRFFSDKAHIQQYVDRDRYVNDTTGKVKEIPFPDNEWVQNHLLGNINNRSSAYQRHWMLEDRYGNNISLLP